MWKKLKRALKKAAKKVKQTIVTVLNVTKDVTWRLGGIPEFLGSLVGWRATKYLRVKIWVLTQSPHELTDTLKRVEEVLASAKNTLKRRMNVELVRPDRHVRVVEDIGPSPAPEYALRPEARYNIWSKEVIWYSDHKTSSRGVFGYFADQLGYGEAVNVFWVQDIKGYSGWSYGPYTSICIIDANPVTHAEPNAPPLGDLTTLAHEICHVLGLQVTLPGWGHSSGANNLMNPSRHSGSDNLTGYQVAIARSSRYVTYLRP